MTGHPGWRVESDPRDEEWPIRYSGSTGRIPWTLSVSPALDNPDGPKAGDRIWWETDLVTADAFVLVAGYSRFGRLDWTGHVGVQRYADLERTADEIMGALGDAADTAIRTHATDFVEQMQGLEQRAFRQRPWLTIGRFLETSRDVTLADPALADVGIKAQDPSLAARVFDARAKAALEACVRLISDPDASLRIWLGAPNLRIDAVMPVDDEDQRLSVLRRIVELGAALAEGYLAMKV